MAKLVASEAAGSESSAAGRLTADALPGRARGPGASVCWLGASHNTRPATSTRAPTARMRHPSGGAASAGSTCSYCVVGSMLRVCVASAGAGMGGCHLPGAEEKTS